MVQVSEIPPLGNNPFAGLLRSGLKQLSGDQYVTFTLYRRFMNPIDGMAYWLAVLPGAGTATIRPTPGLASATVTDDECVQAVPGGLGAESIAGGFIINPLAGADQGLASAEPLYVSIIGACPASGSDGAIELQPGDRFDFLAEPINGVWVNAASGGHKFTVVVEQSVSSLSGAPLTISAPGSLHYSTEVEQEEDATIESNMVVFTAESEIQPFNQIGPDELYVGQRDTIRFAFSSRGLFYEEADLYHYGGHALYSINAPLVIDNPVGWSPPLVISNSLPIWLGMSAYVPPWWDHLSCPVPLYPSFLVEDNLPPPFGAVHIYETEALQGALIFSSTLSQSLLVKDRVRVTLYGLDHDGAAAFQAFVQQYSEDWNLIGMMGMPVLVDEKRPQPEFKILAQKKTIAFEVSYQQAAARDIARQLIEKALVQFRSAILTSDQGQAHKSAA